MRKEVIYLSEPKVADGLRISEMHYKESLIDMVHTYATLLL